MANAIGIDLGTTNSVVAYLEGDKTEVIANSEGAKTTPSVVLFPADGEAPVVGDLAKRQLQTQPGRVVRSVKRLMGRRHAEVEESLRFFPFEVEPGPEGEALVRVDDRLMTPEEVSAEVLRKMVRTAEDFLGEDIDQAVITVPAYFNDSQRTATKKAGELAGLHVLRIVNEPTAAALAFGLRRESHEKVAVFDFGGGTFDISILDIDEDVLEVNSTNGDTSLGGDSIDEALTTWLCEAIAEETGVDPRAFAESLQRVYEAAERAKRELSTLPSTVVSLPFICSDESGPKHFNRNIAREEFEALIQPLLDRLVQPCQQCMDDARVLPNQITQVLLVGGSTRIPAVREVVKRLFGREPSMSLNPDEAVARGAAIQAGVLTGALQEVLLLDVTPLSLGIELQGGVFSALIPRNSTIPTSASKTFTTVKDNQSAVKVHVLQGERRMAAENRTLAHFRLTGIEPAPREIPEIAVHFGIDANGILNVSAQDLSSGKRQEITIESYSGVVAPDEAEKIVKDAEAKLDEDHEFMALSRLKTRGRRLTQTVADFLAAHAGELAEDDVKLARERIFRMDMALAGSDSSAIDEAEAGLRELQDKIDGLMLVDRVNL